MASFKLKLKKPEKISQFDDSDQTECFSLDNTFGSSLPASNLPTQVVLPRSVPNHLLLISILEQLCHLYGRNTKQGRDIFQSISEQLAKLNVVSPLLMLDEMSSLREQYRHSVHRMLIAAVHKTDQGKLSLPAPRGFSDPSLKALVSMPIQPSTSTSDFVNQTSRYCAEFVEIEKIGKGGFGAVYKSQNKLDGKMYAVKKVRFKHSKPEVWFRVLREVKALASLQHTNIVGYNAAWLEYGAPTVPTSKGDNELGTASYLADDVSDDDYDDDDDDIIFKDPSALGDHVRSMFPPISTGPKIKVISSNSSSLASSPQSDVLMGQLNAASPSKHVVLNNRGNSLGKNFSYSKKQEFNKIYSQDSVVCNTGKLVGNIWSSLTETGKDEMDLQTSSVHFSLSSTTMDNDSDIEMDGSADVEKNESRVKVFRRSISCDPLATGETNLLVDDSKSDLPFLETDFPLQKSVTLYIQMELCHLTLKEWMQNRNEQCDSENDLVSYTSKNMNIFRQILKAVDYIHSQGVIHRDLKPRNIFLREEGLHVKVGDFGLATDEIISSPLPDDPVPSPDSFATRIVRTGSVLSDHTTGVGTSTYAAPEQLKGSEYNTKCDVYSLGIILFELFQKCDTEMERMKCLNDVRSGIIPDMVQQNWPIQTQYIEQMTNEVPDNRPSAKDMLSGELYKSKDQVINNMRKEIEKLKRQLVEKDKALAEKDGTIAKLLAELNDDSFLAGTSV